MEVILHIGLAKTGTTFIQKICENNHESLVAQDLYYIPLTHFTCWPVLTGNPEPALKQLEKAAAVGPSRLFLSCEDYAALTFHTPIAIDFIDRVKQRIADNVTIALHIRRQDEMFWSLYSTLSINMYMEPYYMLHQIMRQGYLFIMNIHTDKYLSPYYYFCFDYNRHIGRFFDALRAHDPTLRLRIYAYEAEGRFPGRQLFEELAVTDALKHLPTPDQENRRRTMDETAAGFAESFAEAVPPDFMQETRALIESRAIVQGRQQEEISRILMERFGPGNAPLLERFAPSGPEDAAGG